MQGDERFWLLRKLQDKIYRKRGKNQTRNSVFCITFPYKTIKILQGIFSFGFLVIGVKLLHF